MAEPQTINVKIVLQPVHGGYRAEAPELGPYFKHQETGRNLAALRLADKIAEMRGWKLRSVGEADRLTFFAAFKD